MAEPASSRFFIALRPDYRAASRLGKLAADLALRCRGRALAARDLHLTLAFIGERPFADADRLTALLDGLPVTLPGFALDTVGRFGPELLWIGPSALPDWAAELNAAVRDRLRAAEVAFDRKPFNAHLTLVRHARDRAAAERATGPLPPGRAFPVDHWRLLLGGTHPAPTPLRRYFWHRPHGDATSDETPDDGASAGRHRSVT